MTKTYIKISLPGHEDGYICTQEEAKDTIGNMIENSVDQGEPESFEFTTVSLTEEEFANLPKFTGF